MTSTDTTTPTNTRTASTGTEPTAPNVTAVLPAETAEGDGPEQVRTGHAGPHIPGTAGDDTGEGTGRAHKLVWLDPAALAVHPRNVRDDLGDLAGLAASIRAQGVLEALTVIPFSGADGTSGHQLVAGHRRAAAAILAEAPAVPCVVRTDLAATEEDRSGQARHVGAMLAENLHRRGLSAVEEARGVQTMIDLGGSVTSVARTTGLGRKRVVKAAALAQLSAETAAAVSAAGLTLDQAAAVAVYADDPATTGTLIEAAERGPGHFAHALTRAKNVREAAEKAAAQTAELVAAGRTVLTPEQGQQMARLSQLAHDGADLTAQAHAACPGSAAYVSSGWQGVVEVCTDPATYGHTNRYSGATLGTGELTEAERAAASDERRATIAGNREMVAANETRREWLRGYLLRKSAPKAALRFVVETMATDPRALSRWLSGQSNAAQDAASAALGIQAPGLWQVTRTEPTLTSGGQLSDGRLPLALLGHLAGAIESGMHKGSWRSPSAGDARWLRFLAGCGYTLAEVEQRIVDAADQPATSARDGDQAGAQDDAHDGDDLTRQDEATADTGDDDADPAAS